MYEHTTDTILICVNSFVNYLPVLELVSDET